MKYLVTGGTGTVGSQVVRELSARGADVSVLTRDLGKAKSLPKGVRAVQGNLLEPATVRSVFAGMDGVFLVNGWSVSECHEGLMAVNGALLAGVSRIVYLSVHDVVKAPHLPHFGAKIPVELAIRASGMRGAILGANNFYQNDYWYKDAMLQYGVYPQPFGDAGLSRVDVRDIAEAAAIVLTATDGTGVQTYNLVGPTAVTGTGTAETWSRALGKAVAYAGNDLDAWEAQAVRMLPPEMAFDFRLMYSYFQEKGLVAAPADIDRLTKLIGHPPRSFEDFAMETAKGWIA